jgi:hypothetical protein
MPMTVAELVLEMTGIEIQPDKWPANEQETLRFNLARPVVVETDLDKREAVEDIMYDSETQEIVLKL